VSFALAALKESGKAAKRDDGNNDDDDDDEENTTVGVQLTNNQKVWDVTGELLKRIGIAGMINVQVSMKRWAKRAGIKRPLHFSRKLGSRMRRSSTILSPLARKTLDEASKTGKILSSEARTKIKMRAVRAAAAGDLVKRKKFLKSIALFQNFSEAVLDGIAKSLDYVVFIRGDVIIEQGAPGLKLFIIEKGSVDIFVAEPGYDPSQHTPSEPGLPVVGRKVMRLSSGDPFGERALMQSKPRGATCVAVENTTCFVLDRERFLQAIESIEIFDGFGYEDRDRSDVLALGRHIDKFQRMQTSFEEMRKQQQKVDHDSRSNGTASTATGGGSTKNSPTDDKLNLLNPAKKKISARSSIVLESEDDSSEDSNSEDEDDDGSEKKDGGKHITGSSLNEADKEAIDGGLKLQDGLLHLMSAFSPECDDNDTTERIIKTMYRLCRVERIGLFLCDWKKEQLVLSIARKNGARGIRIPMKGIAGNVARNGKCVNVLDAYKEPLFNSTMDQETGFKTKTILAIPIRSHVLIDKKRGENYGKNLVLGVIQLINKKSGRVFKNRDVQLLITVAEMLGHNLDRKQKNGEIQNSKATETISATPVSNINKQIKINVTNCSKILMKYNKNDKKVGKLRLEVQLFHGGEPLCDAESTPLVPATCINSACSNGPLRTLVRKKKNTENTNNLDDNGDGETKENNDKKENDENLRLPEGLKLIKNPGAYDYDFHQTLILNFRVRNIPAAALLCITLWEGKGHSKPRGWGGMRLFGYDKSKFFLLILYFSISLFLYFSSSRAL
jgi:CRP-like cAMP-binding protein